MFNQFFNASLFTCKADYKGLLMPSVFCSLDFRGVVNNHVLFCPFKFILRNFTKIQLHLIMRHSDRSKQTVMTVTV